VGEYSLGVPGLSARPVQWATCYTRLSRHAGSNCAVGALMYVIQESAGCL
jgi:hypothetical protein